MRTVGYYDDSDRPGGTTRYLVELLGGLDRSQYRPVFFAPRPCPWHQTLDDVDVEVICGERPPTSTNSTDAPVIQLPLYPAPVRSAQGLNAIKTRIGWHRWLHREIAQLKALFKQRPVALLHSNNVGEEAAPIAARQAGIAHLIGTLHTEPEYYLFGEHREARHLALQRQSMIALDVAIAVSQHTASAWRDHLGPALGSTPHFQVIPNGISTNGLARRHTTAEAKARLGLSAESLVIGSIGRLDHIKGYGDLLAALALVVTEFPQMQLIHAGTGPLGDALHAEAMRLGIASRVRWLGFQQDVAGLLEATDLYVQPSWQECLPFTVLDAGALGLPVIASAVGGLAGLLDHGEAGWLVPPQDSVALAGAIRQALSNPVERSVRGEALVRRVRTNYTAEAMVKETTACYDLVLRTSRT